MNKPTIKDLAEITGLSASTVDRVVHGRSGVSSKSREKVKLAIHEVGFGLLDSDLMTPPKPKLRFEFLLCELPTSFSNNLAQSVIRAAKNTKDITVDLGLKRISLKTGTPLIHELNKINPESCHGVAIFAIDAPGVRHVVDRLVDNGVNVVTLVSDLPSSRRNHFVGIDNVAAGRVAGTLMGRFLKHKKNGKIGIITGSMRQRDLVERHFGFDQVIRSRFQDFQILPIEEGESVSFENQKITKKLLRQHKDLVGIYSNAAGNRGIVQALKECRKGDDVVLILHELSDVIRDGLVDGTVDAVISQNTGHIARSAMRILQALHNKVEFNHEQEKIGINIYLADNLP